MYVCFLLESTTFSATTHSKSICLFKSATYKNINQGSCVFTFFYQRISFCDTQRGESNKTGTMWLSWKNFLFLRMVWRPNETRNSSHIQKRLWVVWLSVIPFHLFEHHQGVQKIDDAQSNIQFRMGRKRGGLRVFKQLSLCHGRNWTSSSGEFIFFRHIYMVPVGS